MSLLPLSASDWILYRLLTDEAQFVGEDGNITNNLTMQLIAAGQKDDFNKTMVKRSETMQRELSDNLTMMHIYFKSLGITQYEKEENYSVMDLIGKPTEKTLVSSSYYNTIYI